MTFCDNKFWLSSLCNVFHPSITSKNACHCMKRKLMVTRHSLKKKTHHMSTTLQVSQYSVWQHIKLPCTIFLAYNIFLHISAALLISFLGFLTYYFLTGLGHSHIHNIWFNNACPHYFISVSGSLQIRHRTYEWKTTCLIIYKINKNWILNMIIASSIFLAILNFAQMVSGKPSWLQYCLNACRVLQMQYTITVPEKL